MPHPAGATSSAVPQPPALLPAPTGPMGTPHWGPPRTTWAAPAWPQGCVWHRDKSPAPRHVHVGRPQPPASLLPPLPRPYLGWSCPVPWRWRGGCRTWGGPRASQGCGISSAQHNQPAPGAGTSLCTREEDAEHCRARCSAVRCGASCPNGACPAVRAVHVTAGAGVAAAPCPMARGKVNSCRAVIMRRVGGGRAAAPVSFPNRNHLRPSPALPSLSAIPV